jgi:hypothetical protein
MRPIRRSSRQIRLFMTLKTNNGQKERVLIEQVIRGICGVSHEISKSVRSKTTLMSGRAQNRLTLKCAQVGYAKRTKNRQLIFVRQVPSFPVQSIGGFLRIRFL